MYFKGAEVTLDRSTKIWDDHQKFTIWHKLLLFRKNISDYTLLSVILLYGYYIYNTNIKLFLLKLWHTFILHVFRLVFCKDIAHKYSFSYKLSIQIPTRNIYHTIEVSYQNFPNKVPIFWEKYYLLGLVHGMVNIMLCSFKY